MTTEHHEIIVVGAGFAGIGAMISLREAGFDDVLAVDDASGPGGVWHWNTYPGVAVDIPSYSYQFSFAQRPDWSRSYAPGAELKAYAQWCVDEYHLAPHMRFDTRVTAATYDEGSDVWRITTSGGALSAKWLVHAGGPLSQPKLPDIDGVGAFAGDTMHTSRWDHSVELTGKRVGIIGTGASAVQVIPEIAERVEHLTVFQRTPIWCLPKVDFAIPRPVQAGLAAIPGAKALSRLVTQAYVEYTFPVIAHYGASVPGRTLFERAALAYLAQQVDDPAIREKLTPRYALGCKRPSFHNWYLRTFNRTDVTLETTTIDAITPDGVRTVDGTEHSLDVLVLATGFKVTDKDALPTYALAGRGGIDLAEAWDADRLHSYQGVSVPGYPNFFTVFGPYGYNGSSYFALVENSMAHIVRVLREARRRGSAVVEVTTEAEAEYMAGLERRKRHQIFWDPSCRSANSYYFTKQGDVPLRPSTTVEAAWRSRRFPIDAYSFAASAG
ncbi:NAD(P)/FAD-dependent oxidoreductase [Tsukamurella sp. 8F]|uniref:flavin-containing monooxygenase n=1 Tax=unclassified Tsukamurella TaxID=2633480 RepID=UPI0023B98FCF|nr:MULTISPECIES: NAD(P)/FAD-dependent oxidoreductase [unclassified Tsukamurella]MDF0531389.1 NAD(P)/FAD-dependent oxidoreductase [Tsukamurella sp. 8J]MDF0585305.1 NAD(P)/FAD-dependent oxidoreductase [Tsukamurella sp. 8F]